MSVSCGVKELFVPDNRAEDAKKEAESMPALEITKVCTMLVSAVSDLDLGRS